MRFVIPGGSGQVGTMLCRALASEGHEVVVLSRAPATAPWPVVAWDGRSLGDWARELDGADVVINLAGRSVDCRYTRANRDAILRSRVDSTRVVGEAIAAATRAPPLWLQASTATIYAHTCGDAHDERGAIGGDEPGVPETWRFSIDVARAWEQAIDDADTPATRKVKLRSAMTMSPDRGGVFATLLGLTRLGLGGSVAGGKQYVSWVHEEDFVRAVVFLVERTDLEGAVNVAAPEPLPYAEFMAALRRAWGAPFGLPATRWMLEVGCFVLRTESELVLKSRRVVPGKLAAAGFRFHHPEWPPAAAELCARYRTEVRAHG